jgi:hypothetical protein
MKEPQIGPIFVNYDSSKNEGFVRIEGLPGQPFVITVSLPSREPLSDDEVMLAAVKTFLAAARAVKAQRALVRPLRLVSDHSSEN